MLQLYWERHQVSVDDFNHNTEAASQGIRDLGNAIANTPMGQFRNLVIY